MATPERKVVRRKKSTAKRTGRPTEGKSTRRVKKSAAKSARRTKTTAKRTAANGNGKVSRLTVYNETGDKLVELTGGDPAEVAAAAKKIGISVGKAQRLHARATLKPSERVVPDSMDVKDLAKTIVRMRDEEGLSFVPDIWARTGLGPAKIKALYRQGGGTGATGGAKKSTAKRTSTNGGARKKRTAKAGGRRRSKTASA